MKITEENWERFRLYTKEYEEWDSYPELMQYKNPFIDEWYGLLKVWEKDYETSRASFHLKPMKKIQEFIFILKTERILNDK